MEQTMKIALLFVLSLISGAAFALTDYQCVNDCMQRGYLYGYCQSACSYTIGPPPVSRQTDWQCMSDCQSKGYLYQYCQSICSY